LTTKDNAVPIPASAVGIGLKPAHYRDVLSPTDDREGAGDSFSRPIEFFEVHAENYMCAGGPPHAWLSAIAEHYPISVHGVCLSLGGFDELDRAHLKRLRAVVERYSPALISEHIAWSAHDGVFYNDLIAPPLSEESLTRTARHIAETQDALGRRILIENPSQYMQLPADMSEPDFMNALVCETGCGLLLDINNVFVSARNLGFDAEAYLETIDASAVEEIHLAGHAIDRARGVEMRIDDHGSPVSDEVGALYRRFVEIAGARPTLVEWDTNTPSLAVMAEEAAKAARWMREGLGETQSSEIPAHAHV